MNNNLFLAISPFSIVVMPDHCTAKEDIAFCQPAFVINFIISFSNRLRFRAVSYKIPTAASPARSTSIFTLFLFNFFLRFIPIVFPTGKFIVSQSSICISNKNFDSKQCQFLYLLLKQSLNYFLVFG